MNAIRVTACVLAVAVWALPAGSEAGEGPINGAEIVEVLAGKTVTGSRNGRGWTQTFGKDGGTVFVLNGDQPSPGRWKVSGDQYCSLWPPSPKWDCYGMTADLAASPVPVTWVYPDGTKWPGVVTP